MVAIAAVLSPGCVTMTRVGILPCRRQEWQQACVRRASRPWGRFLPNGQFGRNSMPGRRSSPSELNVRVGSKPEVSDGHENVGCWGQSGSRFRGAGCLLVAKRRRCPFRRGGGSPAGVPGTPVPSGRRSFVPRFTGPLPRRWWTIGGRCQTAFPPSVMTRRRPG